MRALRALRLCSDVRLMITAKHITSASEKASLAKDIVRQAYDMMEALDAQLAPNSGHQRRTDAEFEAWRRKWFLGEVQKDMRHILLLDHLGLRAFVSYVPETQDKQISLCNLFIRPSAQGDGHTLMRLLSRLLAEVEAVPCNAIHISTDKRNLRAQKLATKLGFQEQERTDLDILFVADKRKLLQRLARMRRHDKTDAGYA